MSKTYAKNRYQEKVKIIPFRCPVSRVDEFKKEVRLILDKFVINFNKLILLSNFNKQWIITKYSNMRNIL